MGLAWMQETKSVAPLFQKVGSEELIRPSFSDWSSQMLHKPGFLHKGLPPHQNERDLILDRQSRAPDEQTTRWNKPNRRFRLWWMGNRLQ